MEPLVSGTMTRHLAELVYRPLSEYFVSSTVVGGEVHLRMRPDAGVASTALAEALRHPQLVSAAAHGDVVIAKFDSRQAAQNLSLELPLVALGPFQVVASDTERLVLGRKVPGGGAPEIEVTAVSSEDEVWRRLIAGEFDLLPQVMPGTARHLAEIPTLRIVPVEFPQKVAIWFNVTRQKTSDVQLRRAIALAVRRVPLAVSVTEDPRLASSEAESATDAGRYLRALGVTPQLPMRLVMIVPAAESEFVRAALVLQQQLAVIHVLLDVEALDLSELSKRLATRDFDLMLFYGSTAKGSWDYLLSGAPANFIGYASSDFDAAVRDRDEARAFAILQRDVPLTPLFVVSESVVVRKGWCAVRPKYSHDLAWIGDVRACRAGEEL